MTAPYQPPGGFFLPLEHVGSGASLTRLGLVCVLAAIMFAGVVGWWFL